MNKSATYPVHLTDFVKKGLNSLMGFPDDGQLTSHLLSLSSYDQLEEYTRDIMGPNKAVLEFTQELWRRKTGQKPGSKDKKPSNNNNTNNNQTNTINATNPKPSNPRASDVDIYSSAVNTSTAAIKQKNLQENTAAAASSSPSHPDLGLGRNIKVKYVQSGKIPATVSHRIMCHCQATTHPLFTNCTSCGKIICMAEGEGPCFFCGSLVMKTNTFISEEFKEYMRGMDEHYQKNKEKEEAKESSNPNKNHTAESSSSSSSCSSVSSTAYSTPASTTAEGLQKAELQKNKLLSFAANSKHQSSTLLDDQNDWFEFESNQWLSAEQKKKKKEEADEALRNLEKRRSHTITFDLENKKIIAHNSDAWLESVENKKMGNQTKWTDEQPSSSDPSSSSSSAPPTHGSIMSSKFSSSPQLQRGVEEMKIISRKQYYSNDTLTGRAKEVYNSLKNSLREKNSAANLVKSYQSSSAAASSSSSSSSSAHPTTALLSSLAHPPSTTAKGYYRDAEEEEAELLEGIEDEMTELQMEEQLAQNREKKSANTAAAATTTCMNATVDEDEPTHCGIDNKSCFNDDTDKGVCMSLWQPYASLLVLGIKRFEGRGWYTPHRGRLWIASGSREVTAEEIAGLEEEYRNVYGPHAKIPFPKEYPTSTLLGCVDLVNVWSSEEFQEYREKNIVGMEDSQSAYVFVCTNPRVLPLPQSISGQHKLYNLPPKLVKLLAPSLKPVSEKWRRSLGTEEGQSNSSSSSESTQKQEERRFDVQPNPIKPPSTSTITKPNLTQSQSQRKKNAK